MSVQAKSFEGWDRSIAQLLGSGPKFTVTCGHCEATFKQRIPMVDNPGVVCPHCQTVNVLPLTMHRGVL